MAQARVAPIPATAAVAAATNGAAVDDTIDTNNAVAGDVGVLLAGTTE